MPLGYFASRAAPYERPQNPPILNEASPYAQGLVGLWHFSEGGGQTVHDISGRNAGGTFSGAILPTWEVRREGISVRTDISDDNYINVGNPAHLRFPTEVQSIIVWHQFEGPNVAEQIILGYGAVNTNMNYMIEFSRSSDNKYRYWVNGATVGPPSTATVTDESPHVFGVTRNGSDGAWVLNYYLDGKRDLTDSAFNETTSKNAASELSFGRIGQSTFAQPVEGVYYQIGIWDRVLPPSVMQALTSPDPSARLDLYAQSRVMVPGFVPEAAVIGNMKSPAWRTRVIQPKRWTLAGNR